MSKKLITSLTEIIGGIIVSYGAFQIFQPLGYIVLGTLIIVVSELSA
jgi:hypothetical protein